MAGPAEERNHTQGYRHDEEVFVDRSSLDFAINLVVDSGRIGQVSPTPLVL